MARIYTQSLVLELIESQMELLAAGDDCASERQRLTLAENALLEEGWQNMESATELADLAGLVGQQRADYLAKIRRLGSGLRN